LTRLDSSGEGKKRDEATHGHSNKVGEFGSSVRERGNEIERSDWRGWNEAENELEGR